MKRSSQVALLLMGATGVGASAYAMAPSDCPPPGSDPPAAVGAPAVPAALQPQGCSPRRSWGGSSGSSSSWTRTNSNSHWRRPLFTRTAATTSTQLTTGQPTITRSSTAPTSHPSTPSVPRAGFGGTGHTVSSSGHGVSS